MNCIICGKDLTEKRIKQGKKTCCFKCQLKTPEAKANRSNARKAYLAIPENYEKLMQIMQDNLLTEEVNQKRSKSMIEHYQLFTEQDRQNFCQKIKDGQKSKNAIAKISEASIEHWLDDNYRTKTINSIKSAWTDDKKEHHSTKLKELYTDNDKLKQKISTSVKQAFKNPEIKEKHRVNVTRALQSPKVRQRLSEALKYTYSTNGNSILAKRCETMKKNNSYAKSSWEDYTYELLLTKFKKEDIKRQYFDKERYPFKCDFYIKSLDLFIETHYSEFHGPKFCHEPFDSTNEKHLKRLNELQEKADSKFSETGKESRYHKMIYTWTDLDIRKVNCAKDNNLNWIAFYSIEDFELWLIK